MLHQQCFHHYNLSKRDLPHVNQLIFITYHKKLLESSHEKVYSTVCFFEYLVTKV